MSPGSLLVHRDFRLLLAGQTTSQLGTQVSSVALPLLAVITLAATPFEVGLINAASMLAFATLGLPVGAWLDRRLRRPVLITSDIVRAVLLASIPVAAVAGHLSITQLLVVSLLTGVARVFFDVGYRSYLPSVIGKDQVLAGNASLEFVRASGQVVGPGLGGLLVTLVGAANVVLVQAGTFAVSALTLLANRGRSLPGCGRVGHLLVVRSSRGFGSCGLTGSSAQIVYAITSLSLRQRICPDEMLGRVNATMAVHRS